MYENGLQKEVLFVSENEQIKNIIEYLKKYNMTIYFDDVKDWEDSEEIFKKIKIEVQSSISFFLNDDFYKKNEYYDYNKIKITPGYNLDIKEKTLKIHLKYDNSDPSLFLFSFCKHTRSNVMKEIDKKINNSLKITKSLEDNWKSYALIAEIAIEFEKQIISKIGSSIKIENTNVAVNSYRFKFVKWNVQNYLAKNSVILHYGYLNEKDFIKLTIKLKPVPKVVEIIKFLSSSKLLSFKSDKKIEWISEKKIAEIANNYLLKFKVAWMIISSIFYLKNNSFDLEISNVSKLGPFDNNLKMEIKFNNYQQTIPVQINFKSTPNIDDFQWLQTTFDKIFDNLCFFKNKLINYSNQQLLELLKILIIKYQNDIDKNFIFPLELLTLKNKNIDCEKFDLDLQVEDNSKILKIKLPIF